MKNSAKDKEGVYTEIGIYTNDYKEIKSIRDYDALGRKDE